jgi:CheY-like chemotaxis protein
VTVSILIVDDEPDVAELFRQRFRREARQGTYVLHFAGSGEDALQQLAGDIEPELIVILSDINMPGIDGLELLQQVKRRRPDLPVIMVTAYGDDERRRRRLSDRYSSIARLKAAPGDQWFRAPKLRAVAETTYFAGLRLAGMPEE